MIIDMHTHVYPDKIAQRVIEKLGQTAHMIPSYDGTAKGLAEDMKAAGIDRSVILPVATSPEQVEKINSRAAELNEKWGSEGLFSFGGIHPDYEDYKEELTRISEMGLKGIKVHPIYQGVDLDDIRFLRIFEKCAELGLIVVTHAGDDIGFPGIRRAEPPRAAKVLKEIEGVKMVLAHMGGWKNWEDVLEWLPDSGAYIDTSFSTGAFERSDDGFWSEDDAKMLDEEGFVRIVRAFGAERVLFGTDNPWYGKEKQIEFIRRSGLTEEERKRIFFENAEKLLGESGS